MINYFQQGGEYDNSTDFSQFADLLSGQQQSGYDGQDYEEVNDQQPEEQDQPDYNGLFDRFNELNDRFEGLFQKYGDLINQQADDESANFINQYSQENEPVNWMGVNDDIDEYENTLGSFHQQVQQVNDQNSNLSLAVRNNNPGNIEYGDFVKKYGAVQGTERKDAPGRFYAKFPDTQSGLKAQRDLLKSKNYRNLPIEKALNRWITGDPNKQGEYSGRIAKQFGNRKISELSDTELNSLINQQIKGEDINEAHNLEIKQFGGVVVADTPEKQYEGLNNPYVGVMSFPNEGTNTFRGLDNGRPVMLRDEAGKVKVLYGNQHTAKMKGNVLEHKL